MARINPERDRSLGEIGEMLAQTLLAKAGFMGISNLNKIRVNFPFGDIIADRNGKRFVISVKARNKYERSGTLNSRYKLGSKVYDHARKVSEELERIPAFVAIQLNNHNGTYSGYFGELSLLEGNNAILMGEERLLKYECLGKNIKSDFDFWELKNQY